MAKQLTHTQSSVIGYLISAGGNEYVGATAAEIIAATSLSTNGVYTALRKGIPGVIPCKIKARTGATMYWVNPQAMADAVKSEPNAIWDSVEWKGVPPEVFAGLSNTYDKEPASERRILDLISSMMQLIHEKPEGWQYNVAIGGQVIAMHGLTLAQKEQK